MRQLLSAHAIHISTTHSHNHVPPNNRSDGLRPDCGLPPPRASVTRAAAAAAAVLLQHPQRHLLIQFCYNTNVPGAAPIHGAATPATGISSEESKHNARTVVFVLGGLPCYSKRNPHPRFDIGRREGERRYKFRSEDVPFLSVLHEAMMLVLFAGRTRART